MREFLEKLQEDQRRMRKFLRSRSLHFKRMGEVLAGVRKRGSRIFVVGEPPLDGLAKIVAEEYLAQLPALPIDLRLGHPPSVDPDESDEPAVGREAAARQAARHFHQGDALLAFMNDGEDRETRVLLEGARAKRAKILVIGGLGAKSANNKRMAKVLLALPTRGVKTICESCYVCSRILARVSRAAYRGNQDLEETRLVQATCEVCNERVFFEEVERGKASSCPLCEAKMRVPRDSGRRAATPVLEVPAERPFPKRKRKLKPSVLELPTLNAEEIELITGEPSGEGPVGLASEGDSASYTSVEAPTFGSDIQVGSEIVSATPMEDELPAPGLTTTASADPFALEDAFLADLEMPSPNTPSPSDSSTSGSKRVSARYTIADCRLRWGRGGYPDETGPVHELVSLEHSKLSFVLNPDDEAGGTLQKGDELWARIEIPAFLEPIFVKGSLLEISGTSGNGLDSLAELVFHDIDPNVRRKLERASGNLGAHA